MSRIVNVKFRGEDVDVQVDSDSGYDPSCNGHEIEWHFYGLTSEEHDALRMTDAEEQDIFEQLAQMSYERGGDDE